jgi:ribosomal-protein-serine acetyltransferase
MNIPPPLYPFKLESKILLKPLGPEDTDSFYAFVVANRSHLQRFDPFVAELQTAKDIQKTLTRIHRRHEQGRSLSCGIWEGHNLIGWLNCGLNRKTKGMRIGYGLAEDHQGRGIITHTAQTVLNYAFAELGMKYAWLTCWTTNIPSIHVAERLGFKPEPKIMPAEPSKGILQTQFRFTLQKP